MARTYELPARPRTAAWLRDYAPPLAILLFMLLLPFLIGLLDGQSPGDVLANRTGMARFMQGLLLEIFILAIYAISYDLILGITGLLSFGHAMFFAAGAYTTGILLKSFGWEFLPTVAVIVVVGILQALLFAVVLPRVQGITFALVTLGIASVFHIVVQSNEMVAYTGADVGLQGIPAPDYLNTSTNRFQFYVVTLLLTFLVYALFRRFVNSPTGRVCVAIRENEGRALGVALAALGGTLAALIIASITAAVAGMLHALHQPIVSPNVAGLGWTVAAILMILIGGVGTLSGALVGAAAYRLLAYYLDRWFGVYSSFLLGLVYVALVLFVPYGIVGTWRARSRRAAEGRRRLQALFTQEKRDEVTEQADVRE